MAEGHGGGGQNGGGAKERERRREGKTTGLFEVVAKLGSRSCSCRVLALVETTSCTTSNEVVQLQKRVQFFFEVVA